MGADRGRIRMYIQIQNGTGNETYSVDTEAEIAEAQAALASAGIASADVWAGDPDGVGDSYKSGRVLHARPTKKVPAPTPCRMVLVKLHEDKGGRDWNPTGVCLLRSGRLADLRVSSWTVACAPAQQGAYYLRLRRKV